MALFNFINQIEEIDMTLSMLMELKGYIVLAVAGIFLLNDNVIVLVVGILLALYGASLVIGINPMGLLSYAPVGAPPSAGKEGEGETPIGFRPNKEGDSNDGEKSSKSSS